MYTHILYKTPIDDIVISTWFIDIDAYVLSSQL